MGKDKVFGKFPIYPEEIEEFRNYIQIGQKIWIEKETYNAECCKKIEEEECIVTEKYKSVVVGKNQKGRRRTTTYIELMIRNRFWKKKYERSNKFI